MIRRPSFVVGAILGGIVGFAALVAFDLFSACLFNGLYSLGGAAKLLTTFPEMFLIKGVLGLVTGMLAGAGLALKKRGRGRLAGFVGLIGGSINLALVLIWVLSSLVSPQIRGVPPLYIAFNFLEPTLPPLLLALWGLRLILTVVESEIEAPAESAPLASPF